MLGKVLLTLCRRMLLANLIPARDYDAAFVRRHCRPEMQPVQGSEPQRMFCIEKATITGPVYDSWLPKSPFYEPIVKTLMLRLVTKHAKTS